MVKHFLLSLLVLCSLFPKGEAQNSQKWIISTAQGTGLYGQSWATRLEFPKDFIRDNWNDGKQITSMTYGNGLWAVVLSYGSPYTSQTWVTRGDFDKDLIQQKWKEGYSITNTTFGQGAWAFVFSKMKQANAQTYQLSAEFPQEFIDEFWGKGYFISSIAFGSGKWFVCMDQRAKTEQSYIKSRDFPEDWVQQKLETNFEITHLTFGDGYWTVVASKADSYYNVLYANSSFPKSEISLTWSQEAAITDMVYGFAPKISNTLKASQEETIVAVSRTSTGNAQPNLTNNGQPRFHLICAMDTRDRMLGAGAKAALQVVQDQFSAAAKSIGYELHPVVIAHDQFSLPNLQSNLLDLQTGAEDIIVFYYFGHGFRYTNDASRYPTCFIGKNGVDQPKEVAWPLTDIYQGLIQKKARLTLVFAECCNNEIGIPAPIDSYIAARQMSVNYASKDRYKVLFLQNKGSILLASSDQGQPSWATTTGGYFLDSFMDAIQYQVSSGNTEPVSWKSLLEDTDLRVKKLASVKNRTQEPIYTIQIQ